ncbi:MAG: hypothetical protein R3F04_06580 [Lysobacteraceae bacterium]
MQRRLAPWTLAAMLLINQAAAEGGPATQLGPGSDEIPTSLSPHDVRQRYEQLRQRLAQQESAADPTIQAQLESLQTLLQRIERWEQLRGGRAKKFVTLHQSTMRAIAEHVPEVAPLMCAMQSTPGSRVETASCRIEDSTGRRSSEEMQRLNQASPQTG